MMTHILKMEKHQFILFLSIVIGSFMIGKVKGRINPLVDFSTREEAVHVAGYGEEKISTVVITGQVLCISCVDVEAQLPPHPVSGALVVVLCGYGKRRKAWAGSVTDAYGEFFIDIPSHLHAITNLEKFCYVKIIQSSTNKYKRRKIKLMSNDGGVRTYTTESIHHISLRPNTSACKISHD